MKIMTIASSSKGNAYLIDNGSDKILLDCGLSGKELRRRVPCKLSDLSACLVTHHHADHSKGVHDLLKFGVQCCMSIETAAKLGLEEDFNVTILEPPRHKIVGSWIVRPFETLHDCEGSLGFLVATTGTEEKILYVTDTGKIDMVVPGLTHILIEANYDKELLTRNVQDGTLSDSLRDRIKFTHLGIDDVLEFLEKTDKSSLEEIYLIHASDGNSNVADFKRRVMELTGLPVFIAEA